MLAANGIGKDAFWESLLAGRSGIGPVTLFDPKDYTCRIAGEVRDFHPESHIDAKHKPRRMSRNVQFAVAAAQMALADARLDVPALRKVAPILVHMGVSLGGFERIESQIRRVAEHGPNRLLPSAVEACIHLASASTIAAILDVPAKLQTLSNSCVGGIDAICAAATAVSQGDVDVAIAGGADASITPSALAGFCAAGMVTTSNSEPRSASRPFDLMRDGGILAEGSGVVVLESLDHALARGATPYMEVLAFSSSNDQIGEESGSGLARTMRDALAHAGCIASDIDGICAHGPSDPTLDRVETAGVKTVLGMHAYRIPVTSIKAVTGNALAASGGHQVVASALALRDQRVPPTANLTSPDPACDLDYVAGGSRSLRLRRILINGHGSGRTNSSMIVGLVTAV